MVGSAQRSLVDEVPGLMRRIEHQGNGFYCRLRFTELFAPNASSALYGRKVRILELVRYRYIAV